MLWFTSAAVRSENSADKYPSWYLMPHIWFLKPSAWNATTFGAMNVLCGDINQNIQKLQKATNTYLLNTVHCQVAVSPLHADEEILWLGDFHTAQRFECCFALGEWEGHLRSEEHTSELQYLMRI